MTIGQETRGSIPHVELKICPESKDAIPRVESTTAFFCDLNTRQPNNAAACTNGRLSRCGTALSFALTQQCPSCERTQQEIDVSTLVSQRSYGVAACWTTREWVCPAETALKRHSSWPTEPQCSFTEPAAIRCVGEVVVWLKVSRTGHKCNSLRCRHWQL